MKKSLLLLLLVGGLSWEKCAAQDTVQVAPQFVVQTILEKLHHEVNLTEQQRLQVHNLLLERSKQYSLIINRNKSKKLAVSSFQEVNAESFSMLKTILTPEQNEKLQLIRQEEQRQKMAYTEDKLYKSVQDMELDF